MNTELTKIPQTFEKRELFDKTGWDVMEHEERELVYMAYCLNKDKDIYELTRPELLTDKIIAKLIIAGD